MKKKTRNKFSIKEKERIVLSILEEDLLSNTGKHQFVEVIKDGKTYIYDNNYPEGIVKEEYVKQLGGFTSDGKILEGENLFSSEYVNEVYDYE